MREVGRVFGLEEAVLKEPRRKPVVKPAGARCLVRDGGQTPQKTAAKLGLRTGAPVAAQLKRLQDWVARERKLPRQVLWLEGTSEALQTERGKVGESKKR